MTRYLSKDNELLGEITTFSIKPLMHLLIAYYTWSYQSYSGITEDNCVRYLELRLTASVAGVESIKITVVEIHIVRSV